MAWWKGGDYRRTPDEAAEKIHCHTVWVWYRGAFAFVTLKKKKDNSCKSVGAGCLLLQY